MMGTSGGDWEEGGVGVRVAEEEGEVEEVGSSISELGSPPEDDEDVEVLSLLLKAVK